MTVIIRENTQHFLRPHVESDTTQGEFREAGRLPAADLIERVNEILGYDIFAANQLAAGYREYADESLGIAESNLSASAEILPDE